MARVSPEIKNARFRLSVITREAERLLDATLGRGYDVITPDALQGQVALNTSLPLKEVELVVRAYLSVRSDLYLSRGKAGGIRKRIPK